MKKLLLLLFVGLLTISCSSSDDDVIPSQNSDPILGKWQLTSDTINGLEVSTDCDRLQTAEFYFNGTSKETYYFESISFCVIDSELKNEWKNIGDSTYKIIYENGEVFIQKINFSSDNTIISLTENDGGKIYVTTFKKI